MKRFLIYHLPPLLYAAAILTLSSMRHIPDPGIEIPGLDKFAHFLEYALFAILTFRSFSNIGQTESPSKAALFSLLFLICFAALDEKFQSYIPGRDSSGWDILSDTIGSAVVLAILWYRKKKQ